ncbi:GNAT family N-acetyltransferase [Thiomicrorhabdus sp. 6S2-11]|uniref:GNAT family N-acetyltransferase n=1 Tax=Thiomicrorhabdus marina TaxID=2818442 RepID=A0ABS3Q7Z1_9GAMM|nr:GNAT family N-acetyltransferase [Thiomicrorhabdus marina]MBO1928454.1 GNAT family N-acetyltransferase [Thiomicrorhabdus marina]
MINPPELLAVHHDTNEFNCGKPVLDNWLKNQALKNQTNRGSRTFVITSGNRVVGYYALASGAVERTQVASNIARNMPNPIPVVILARLAIDINFKGLSLGKGLLKDSLLRSLNVANEIGVKAVLVHALDKEARTFYERFGFQPMPEQDNTLMISISNIEALLRT